MKNIDNLNDEQKMAAKLAIDTTLLQRRESSTDSSDKVSRLQLILGQN